MVCNPSSKKKRRIQSTAATTMKICDMNINGSLTHKATAAQSVPAPPSSSKATTTTTKYANRYEPDKPLTRPEDIKAWRNAARRKRNRESAEKSRNKVRDRILELEDQVEDYKSRYLAALEKIHLSEEESSKTQSTSHPYSSIGSPLRLSSARLVEEFGTVSPISSTDDDDEVPFDTIRTAPPLPSLVEFGSLSSRSTSTPPTTEKNTAVRIVENGVVRIEVVKLDEHHQNVIEITSRPA